MFSRYLSMPKMSRNAELKALVKAAFGPKEWQKLVGNSEFVRALKQAKSVDAVEEVIGLGSRLLASQEGISREDDTEFLR